MGLSAQTRYVQFDSLSQFLCATLPSRPIRQPSPRKATSSILKKEKGKQRQADLDVFPIFEPSLNCSLLGRQHQLSQYNNTIQLAYGSYPIKRQIGLLGRHMIWHEPPPLRNLNKSNYFFFLAKGTKATITIWYELLSDQHLQYSSISITRINKTNTHSVLSLIRSNNAIMHKVHQPHTSRGDLSLVNHVSLQNYSTTRQVYRKSQHLNR